MTPNSDDNSDVASTVAKGLEICGIFTSHRHTDSVDEIMAISVERRSQILSDNLAFVESSVRARMRCLRKMHHPRMAAKGIDVWSMMLGNINAGQVS